MPVSHHFVCTQWLWIGLISPIQNLRCLNPNVEIVKPLAVSPSMSLFWHWKPDLTYDMLCWNRKTGIVCVSMMASVSGLDRHNAFFSLQKTQGNRAGRVNLSQGSDAAVMAAQVHRHGAQGHGAHSVLQHTADFITSVSPEHFLHPAYLHLWFLGTQKLSCWLCPVLLLQTGT